MTPKIGRHRVPPEWMRVFDMYIFAIENDLPTIPPDLHGKMEIKGDFALLFLVTIALGKHPFVQRAIEEWLVVVADDEIAIEVVPANGESKAQFVRATVEQREPNFVIRMQLDANVPYDEDWVYLRDHVISIYRSTIRHPLYAEIKGLGVRSSAPGYMEHWFGNKGADDLYLQLVQACAALLEGESVAAQLKCLVRKLTDVQDFPRCRKTDPQQQHAKAPKEKKAAYYALQCGRAALHCKVALQQDAKVAADMANVFPDEKDNLPKVSPEDIIAMQEKAAARGHFITCGALVLRLTVLACMWMGTIVEKCMTDELFEAVQKVADENRRHIDITGYPISPRRVPKMIYGAISKKHCNAIRLKKH